MSEQVELILVGFSVVMGVLCFLWLVCSVGAWALKDRKSSGAKAALKEKEDATPPVVAPIPGAHLAALSAAVATMIPGAHRIVRVYARGHTVNAWVIESRYTQASSRVRWDWAASGEVSPSGSKPD